MPTIVLRHVTKRYDTLARKDSLFDYGGRMLSGGLRAMFDSKTSQYVDATTTHHEPPDRVHALDDLNLTVHDGETLSILGPSGCGKTTLLKVMAGLIQPDEGEVLFDHTPIKDIPLEERGIGMVFQSYALYPHMKSFDNIGFYDILRKQPERIPERIKRIMDVMGVELEHILSRKPPTLSGGEQQRVAVARCLARDPKAFLFDEPLSNLDAKLRVSTRVQIKRLLAHYRITSVYVTHDQVEAIALADRIAIMRAGKIEQIGTFQTLYETPINAFVAQFFGSPPMNLFQGRAVDDRWQGQGFTIDPIRPGLLPNQPVWLGVRPEHVELADSGIAARIEHIEPMHTQRRQLVYMLVGREQCVASFPIEHTLKLNATICLRFPTEHVFLFDQKTGLRIG